MLADDLQESWATESFATALMRRLRACGDPGSAPAQLADLFRWSFGKSADANALTHALQASLLRWTLERAVERNGFYSRAIYRKWLEAAPRVIPDLSELPVIRRADVIANLSAITVGDLTLGALCHTSGCTGASLPVYKSEEELSFLWHYQTHLQGPVRRQLASRPLILSMPNLYHGTAVRVPSIGKVFVAGVTDDLLIADVVPLLRQRFQIPGFDERISIITCLVHQILFLTTYLLEQGIDPREFGIRSLNVIGGYVTKRARAFLGIVWGAMVFDRFSLTESAGGATRCHECGSFHLDPHVIGEVLDPDSDEPVEDAVGRLILTELYPFVQMQPFIRYDTGDLVRPVHNRCSGTLAFEFAGKTNNCIKWKPSDRTEWLILSVTLHEVLDPIPDFRRVEQFRAVSSTRDPSVGSLPIYSLTAVSPQYDTLVITLAIELRYAPEFFPERTAELREQIWRSLAAQSPQLRARVAQGAVEFQIRFVGPGALGDRRVLKI